MLRQFLLQRFERRFTIFVAEIDDVEQHFRALDVPEEIVSEPFALRRAFDDAGNVRDRHGTVTAQVRDAQVGADRCERVRCDFGVGACHRGEECRLARIRQSDQSNFGDKLEFEDVLDVFAGFAQFGEAGGIVFGGLEPRIALAAAAAARGQIALARLFQIADDFVRLKVFDERALRYLDLDVGRILAVLLAAEPMLAPIADPVGMVLKELEGVESGVYDKVDIAAVTTVAAVRPAMRHELLAPETGAAVTAGAPPRANTRVRSTNMTARHRARPYSEAASTTSTHFVPFLMKRNCTTPSAFNAKRVSSLPRPTFSPGMKFRAALTNDDVAGDDLLAAELLDAQPLCGTVATVS